MRKGYLSSIGGVYICVLVFIDVWMYVRITVLLRWCEEEMRGVGRG